MGARPKGSTTTSRVTNELKTSSGTAPTLPHSEDPVSGMNRHPSRNARAFSRVPAPTLPARPPCRQVCDARGAERASEAAVEARERLPHGSRILHEHQGLQARRPAGHPLGQARVLDAAPPAGPYRVRPGAELALDLAALRLNAHPPQRRRHELDPFRVPLVEAVAQVPHGNREREGERAPVGGHRPATGVAHEDREARLFGHPRCRREAPEPRLRPRDPDVGGGGPHKRRGAAAAGGDLLQDGLLQAEAVLRVLEWACRQDLHGYLRARSISVSFVTRLSSGKVPSRPPEVRAMRVPTVGRNLAAAKIAGAAGAGFVEIPS